MESCDWSYLRNRAGVRIVSRTTPLGPILHDCTVERSTLPKGGEDEFFQDEVLRNTLRRGISFIEVKPGTEKVPELLRRGVPKFFDMSPDVLQDLRKICGHAQCAVVSTEKANGENAQISRFHDWWVVASKNVCLIARSASDVELYVEARYRFATEIGRVFFSILDSITDRQLREEFETFCQQNTLVGELIGFTQHFVRYDKRDIQFFAIVPKNGRHPCRPPMDSILRLTYFGLPVIRSQLRVGSFDNVVGTKEPVFSENSEGCVSYVLARGRVIGMYKAKTRRYQLLRKLRAKTKRFATGGVTEEAMMAEFQQEFHEEDSLRRELEDYARRMFSYISSENLSTDEVDSKFLDVLDNAKKSVIGESRRPVCIVVLCPPFLDSQKSCDEAAAKALINAGKDAVIVFHSPKLAQNFIAAKRSIRKGQFHVTLVRTGWCDDGIQECIRMAKRKRTADGMTRQMETFWKQQGKWEILLEKWQEIATLVNNADSDLEVPYGETMNFDEIRTYSLTQAPRCVEVVLAVGLPGMGKSTLLGKLGIPIVSSDAIVAGLTGSYDRRRYLAREEFNKAWRQRMKSDEAFALDKNFDPTSLLTTLREIHQESTTNGIRIRIRIFLFVESTNFDLPLWCAPVACECACRLVHRTVHETLNASQEENRISALRVLLSFYALWKEWSPNRVFKEIMHEFRGTVVLHHVSAPPLAAKSEPATTVFAKLLNDWTPWSKQPVEDVRLPQPQVTPAVPQLDLLIKSGTVDYLALTFTNDVVPVLQSLAKKVLGNCTLPETFHCTLFHHKQKIISLGTADYTVSFDSPIRLVQQGIAVAPVSVLLGTRLLTRGHVTLGWIEPWKAKYGALLESTPPGEKVQTHMGAFAVEDVPCGSLQMITKATLQAFERR